MWTYVYQAVLKKSWLELQINAFYYNNIIYVAMWSLVTYILRQQDLECEGGCGICAIKCLKEDWHKSLSLGHYNI